MDNLCEHGAERERHKHYGEIAFAAPLATCECCGTVFPYIEMQFITDKVMKETKWEPKNRCSACGGRYVQTVAYRLEVKR